MEVATANSGSGAFITRSIYAKAMAKDNFQDQKVDENGQGKNFTSVETIAIACAPLQFYS
jgi:hypothetical protein